MKEHSDTTVPHSFVNKNSGSNLVQKPGFFFWFLANKTLNFSPIYIILDSLKAELSELKNHMSKYYVSSIHAVRKPDPGEPSSLENLE